MTQPSTVEIAADDLCDAIRDETNIIADIIGDAAGRHSPDNITACIIGKYSNLAELALWLRELADRIDARQ